jgi:hypothetical protein
MDPEKIKEYKRLAKMHQSLHMTYLKHFKKNILSNTEDDLSLQTLRDEIKSERGLLRKKKTDRKVHLSFLDLIKPKPLKDESA